MTGKKISVKKVEVFIVAVALMFVVTGCTLLSQERVKLQNLEFTVLAEEKIPEELLSIVNEKKEAAFQFTFSDKDYLYICIGYGEQATGGYSIAVNEFYLTDSAIYVNTELLGPDHSEKSNPVASYPYIVIKTEYREEPVIFE